MLLPLIYQVIVLSIINNMLGSSDISEPMECIINLNTP